MMWCQSPTQICTHPAPSLDSSCSPRSPRQTIADPILLLQLLHLSDDIPVDDLGQTEFSQSVCRIHLPFCVSKARHVAWEGRSSKPKLSDHEGLQIVARDRMRDDDESNPFAVRPLGYFDEPPDL